jgi:hypothetical protein
MPTNPDTTPTKAPPATRRGAFPRRQHRHPQRRTRRHPQRRATVGDVLRLRWHADHNSDPLAGHCLHRDDLTIQVRRGQRLWTFLLDITVRPAHQRMVTTATPQ